MISILPAKGIPLPFISYGGSSVLVTLIGVGILLSISRFATEQRKQQHRGAEEEGQAPQQSGVNVNKMKVLFAAGGTGGHIYPAIAVAKEIMRRDAESEILFVGTAAGLRNRDRFQTTVFSFR